MIDNGDQNKKMGNHGENILIPLPARKWQNSERLHMKGATRERCFTDIFFFFFFFVLPAAVCQTVRPDATM